MGQAAIAGEILRSAGSLLKRRLLVALLALPGDLTRREGAGLLLGRVLETSAVESLGLRGGLVSLVAVLEVRRRRPDPRPRPPRPSCTWLCSPPGPRSASSLVARTGLHLAAWTDARAAS